MNSSECPEVFSGEFENVDDYLGSLRGWQLEFSHLEPGNSSYSNLTFNACDYSYLQFSHSVAGRRQVKPTAQGFSFLVSESTPRPLIVGGQSHSSDVLCCGLEGDLVDLLTTGSFQGYAVRFSQAMLAEQGCAWMLEVPSANGYRLSLPQTAAESIRQCLREVAQLLRNPNLEEARREQEIDDIYREALVPAVASAVSVAAVDSGPVEDSLETLLRFIDEHLYEPLTVEQLGGSIGVSSRYVQQLFKRHLGISPKYYIRCMRLNAVRRELKRLSRRRGLITEVASSFGFDHLGQFAGDYKALFGELPNETLGRAA